MSDTLIKLSNLTKHFNVEYSLFGKPTKIVQAVENVSFDIFRGETLGLVGESGCGKTTIGRTIVGLYEPTAGTAVYEGKDIHAELKGANHLAMKRKIQMIFQDPYASLNPRMTVGDIIAEPLIIHKICNGQNDRTERVHSLLRQVGLNPEHAGRFPHEFSGGQRQRIGFARALAVDPKFIVCDEPISALDVSIQAQVVNLLQELQQELGLTYLFVAHDLSMVRHISHRVAVMYLGALAELASRNDLYTRPQHPYTKALLSAIPIPDPVIEQTRQRIILEGDVPSPLNPPSGCKFRTRCKYALARCAEEIPELREVAPNHFCACHIV
ncbi:MAG: oligopeptide/dipeptide ABC transporter ATP-binding protein [Negativicutes bacterium]|jgi:oligopeptide transport system ATP-binding protein